MMRASSKVIREMGCDTEKGVGIPLPGRQVWKARRPNGAACR